MIRGLYAAGSGLDAILSNQDAITENMAHANVPGYRRLGSVTETFEPVLAQATAATTGVAAVQQSPRGSAPPPPPVPGGGGELWGNRPSFVFTDFTPGPLQQTNNPLDLAATDNATWFVVDGPNGPVLTRNGQFALNDRNQLITRSGLLVRSTAGPITIPADATNINFGPEGLVTAQVQGQPINLGTLLLASVPNPTSMIRVGDTLFQGPVPSGPGLPGTVHIQQGYLEQPNQDIVHDMVDMINGLRHYEAAERSLRSLSDALAENTRPQA
jgi:flagellar basal body rod protein FlgG